MYYRQSNLGYSLHRDNIQCIALSTFQTTGLGSDGWEAGGVGKEYYRWLRQINDPLRLMAMLALGSLCFTV